MQAMIDELAKQAAESLGQVSGKETLASFWQEYLSKNGKIPALMKNLRTVAPEERPAMGKIINELKAKVQADYDAAAEQVKQAELAARNAAETVDITLPAKTRSVGGLHPLTLITNQIIDVFSGMGFSVGTFPEIEDDDHSSVSLHAGRRAAEAGRVDLQTESATRAVADDGGDIVLAAMCSMVRASMEMTFMCRSHT